METLGFSVKQSEMDWPFRLASISRWAAAAPTKAAPPFVRVYAMFMFSRPDAEPSTMPNITPTSMPASTCRVTSNGRVAKTTSVTVPALGNLALKSNPPVTERTRSKEAAARNFTGRLSNMSAQLGSSRTRTVAANPADRDAFLPPALPVTCRLGTVRSSPAWVLNRRTKSLMRILHPEPDTTPAALTPHVAASTSSVSITVSQIKKSPQPWRSTCGAAFTKSSLNETPKSGSLLLSSGIALIARPFADTSASRSLRV